MLHRSLNHGKHAQVNRLTSTAHITYQFADSTHTIEQRQQQSKKRKLSAIENQQNLPASKKLRYQPQLFPAQSRSPAPQIPSTCSVTTFNQGEVMEVVKILRGNNNVKNNCVHLSTDLLKYFRTGQRPQKPSISKTSISDDIFQSVPHYQTLLAKFGSPYSTVVKSVIVKTRGDFPLLSTQRSIAIKKDDQHPNQIHSWIIYDAAPYQQQSAEYSNINNVLMLEAKKNSHHVSFGVIFLYISYWINPYQPMQPQINNLQLQPGHMICYFATDKQVWYIDCHHIDGITQQDHGTIFSDLTQKYLFSSTTSNNQIQAYGDVIFYIPFHPITTLTPALAPVPSFGCSSPLPQDRS